MAETVTDIDQISDVFDKVINNMASIINEQTVSSREIAAILTMCLKAFKMSIRM